MSVGLETTIVDRWLYAMLSGDAVLDGLAGWNGTPQVWDSSADAGTPSPWVVFQYVSGTGAQTFNGTRILLGCTYQVVVDGIGDSFAALDPLIARIETLLDRFVGACDGGYIQSCQRGRPIKLEIDQDGVHYKRLGAEFRIQATRSS